MSGFPKTAPSGTFAPIGLPGYVVGATYQAGQLISLFGTILQAKSLITSAPNPVDYTTWTTLGENLFVDPRTHGAALNAVILSDAAINIGVDPNTLSSASATFKASDAGKIIVVRGAGVAGAALVTTVASFVDAHDITITAAASTTVAAAVCIYGTDDSAVFNSIWSTVAPFIRMPKGKFAMIGAQLTPGNGCGIVGAGFQMSASRSTLLGGLIMGFSGTMVAPTAAAFNTMDVAFLDASGAAAANTCIGLTFDLMAVRTQFLEFGTANNLGTSTFYTKFDTCEWLDNTLCVNMGSAATDLHFIMPRASASASATAPQKFLAMGGSSIPVSIHGGSIEGYANAGITMPSHSYLTVFGTYFESTAAVTPVAFSPSSSSTLNLEGCYFQMNNTNGSSTANRILNASGITGFVFNSRGNKFAGTTYSGSGTPTCYQLPTSGEVNIEGDDTSQLTVGHNYTAGTALPAAGFRVSPPLAETNGSLAYFGRTISTSGGFRASEAANGKQGVATLAAGTVVVANTAITANSRIMLTVQSLGTVTAPKALAVTARTASTSFTITSADATDTSVVAYEIFEPA